MSVRRDSDHSERPDVALRPTRAPRAPFVAGPESPRVASAPRAVAVPGSSPRAESERLRGALLVAAFPRERAPHVVSALRARALEALELSRAEPGAGGLSRELSRALVRATTAATCAGGVGALAGALLVPSDGFVPGLGWIPGPAVGAALLAGVLGASGFAGGLLALLLTPRRQLSLLAEGDHALFVVLAPDVSTAVAAILALGGAPVAQAKTAPPRGGAVLPRSPT